jgi:acetylornithine deacetylase/succinyl-diaminopimelate desuccinylase-like protein
VTRSGGVTPRLSGDAAAQAGAGDAPASERDLAPGPRLDFGSIRTDIESLAALERGSAAADKPHVDWLERRLRDVGAHDVRRESFRFQRRWIWRYGAHGGAGIGAALLGGPLGAGLAAATLASVELDVSGRSTWLARFLPGGEGANVVARIPAAAESRRTVVFIAHHDAQRAGLMWRLPRTQKPLALPAQAVLALIATGCLIGSRLTRAVGAALLACMTLIGLDVARNRVVPGANDNASGVAALIALMAAFARDPLERTDVAGVFSDCEEVGLGGASAWIATHGGELDRASTLVVSLDTLGSGQPAVVGRDGALTANYSRETQTWADRGALRAAVEPPRRVDMVAPTDGSPARHAGLHVLSLTSCAPDGTLGPHYHQPTDTPENVDHESVEQCTRLAAGIARVWDAA